MDSNEIYPLAVFVEELKSSDSKVKLNSIRNLSVICSALGKEKSRTELLPFLSELIEDEDEETLIELTKILPYLIDFIGGKSYSLLIFKLLEILLNLEEINVRNEAIKSFKVLVNLTHPIDIENDVINIISKLASNDWYTQKITAISLISILIPFVNPENRIFLSNYILNYSNEDNSSVKKELCSSLKEFYGIIDSKIYVSIMQKIIKDENDGIKIYIIDNILSMNNKDLAIYNEAVRSLIQDIANNDLWKVRIVIAEKIVELLRSEISQETKIYIIEIFSKFFDETDIEARNMCCVKLDSLCEALSNNNNNNMLIKILAQLKKVGNDNIPIIRISLSNSLLKLCPIIGNSKTNEYIMPIFSTLIKDENYEVRINLLKYLGYLNKVICFEVYSNNVLTSMNEILIHKSYRLRVQLISIIESLANVFDSDLFVENFVTILNNLLVDPVFHVRESACKSLKNILVLLKFNDKIINSIKEKLNEMRQSQNYLIRNTYILFLKELVNNESSTAYIEKYLFEGLIKMTKDKMSNVRLNCGLVLKKLHSKIKSNNISNELRNAIEILKKDLDIDVINTISDINLI